MSTSKIDWCDVTWEPVRGCSHVSPGCDNCWAERMTWRLAHNAACAERYRGLVELRGGHPCWTGEVRCDESVLEAPLHWRKPRRVFVCSRSDLFHEKVPDEFIAALFGVMAACPQHTFLVLTKRSERMQEWFSGHGSGGHRAWDWVMEHPADCGEWRNEDVRWPLPNVWLGTTCEDQQRADERIPDLLATPAAVRFVSYEPALEAVDFSRWLRRGSACECDTREPATDRCGKDWIRCNLGTRRIDWLIVGGESGPGARPCNIEWVRGAVRQCKEAGVACFVKQLGSSSYLCSAPDDCRGKFSFCRRSSSNSKGADPAEWPEDLRAREYPEVRR